MPSHGSAPSNLMSLPTAFGSLLVVFAVWAALRTFWAIPHVVPSNGPPELFSGANAYEYLKEGIAVSEHYFNSRANLAVRQYLLDKIGEFQQIASGRDVAPVIELSPDNINLTTFNNYFESNNVIVRIRNRRTASDDVLQYHPTLLVSAHYDSTQLSYGVTDDGVGVAVILELIRALIYSPPLDYDIVINLNNAEEIGLFGGQSFLLHPWSKNVKAFINLEGTGASMGGRAMLFRTNSYSLTAAYAKASKYPHASVLFNDIMFAVSSDTDYRPYITHNGNIPGIDIAFYQNRYLYHTRKDNPDHSTPESAQHMGENVFDLVVQLCGPGGSLPRMHPSAHEPLSEEIFRTLPSAGFAFYDIAGVAMVTVSGPGWISSISAFLGIVLTVTVLKSVRAWTRIQNIFESASSSGSARIPFHHKESVFRRTLALYGFKAAFPIVASVLLLIVLLGTSTALVLSFSLLRSLVNPGSTYGQFYINLAWIITLVWFSILLIIILWDGLFGTWFLVKSPAHIPHTEDGNQEEENEALLGQSSVRATSEDIHSSVWGSWSDVFPVALLLFWSLLSVPAWLLAAHGFCGAYILFSAAFWGGIAWLLDILVLDVLATRLGSSRFDLTVRPSIRLLISSSIPLFLLFDLLQEVLVGFPSTAPEYGTDLAISFIVFCILVNLVPFIHNFVGKQGNRPSFFTQLKASTSRAHYTIWGFFAGFLLAFLVSAITFPLYGERPQTASFLHEFVTSDVTGSNTSTLTVFSRGPLPLNKLAQMFSDITGASRLRDTPDLSIPPSYVFPSGGECTLKSRCEFKDISVPLLKWPDSTPVDDPAHYVDITVERVRSVNGVTAVEGVFFGATGSRICVAELIITNTTTRSGSPPKREIWIDTDHQRSFDDRYGSGWKTQHGDFVSIPDALEYPFEEQSSEGAGMRRKYNYPPGYPARLRGSVNDGRVVIFRREENSDDARMKTRFLARTINVDKSVTGEWVLTMKVGCEFAPQGVSPVFDELVGNGDGMSRLLPEWMEFAHASKVIVAKEVELTHI
ncbi:hypothetical protein BJ742DRAFT_858265 [Cladochytrium replicatum]|nr:hypothetical protein BJ742DRAFT_858265 [Cladochytrium replicatum]